MFFDVQNAEMRNKNGPSNAIRTFRAAHSHSKVNALDFNLGGQNVFSAADDGCLKMFDLASSDNSTPLYLISSAFSYVD